MSSQHHNKKSPLAQKQNQTSAIQLRATQFEGPLPHPDILEKYEQIVPGGAERIFARFEKQSDHRMKLEATVVNGDNKRANRGLNFGFMLAVFLILGGLFLAYNNKPIEGLAAIGVAAGGLFLNAYWIRKSRKEELAQKR